MEINSAKFVISSSEVLGCPKDNMPEYAFIGRSNVGKSSLINMLTNRKKLAHTSSTPGKTKLINHFLVNGNWYLVDLPGYGYAKISKKEQEKLSELIFSYIKKRENLACLILLIDSRLKPQKKDIDFIEWLGLNEVPFVIVFTKADKLKESKLNKSIADYKNTLLEKWEELPEFFVTSAVDRSGRDNILEFIDNTNKLIHDQQ